MTKPEEIRTSSFDYSLPDERIARYPVSPRDSSQLLVYNRGLITKDRFTGIRDWLTNNNRLIFNNTRVIQARMHFKKPTGEGIEIFCLEPFDPPDYARAFEQTSSCQWTCLVGNARKWRSESLEQTMMIGSEKVRLLAEKRTPTGRNYIVRFQWDNPSIAFAEILEHVGKTPIPPYLQREPEYSDVTNDQTVYAEMNGSVAAPTAGLHFTERLLGELENQGVSFSQLTLHVGAGTFIPVKSENAVHHAMHTETVSVSRDLLRTMMREEKKLVTVGTTSTRSLETLYWLGVKSMVDSAFTLRNLFFDQWEAYSLPPDVPVKEAISSLLYKIDEAGINQLNYTTQIMIVPGYHFKLTDGLITNFHQPRSTLLMLIAAFVGDDWKRIYQVALDQNFRFLSYGDSSLLLPSADQSQFAV